ncbi:cardiotrophin-2 [Heterodontus francisci]|uniref:cardiotrophin-2 n=1 Tax=Heterodontus francisci TaxID=7792 RepID=UPI00355C8291
MQHLTGFLVLLLVVGARDCEGASVAAVTLIRQTHELSVFLQGRIPTLINTYLAQMGSPFSDPGFDVPDVQLESLPVAAIPFITWRRLSVQERVSANYRAYSLYLEFLQLVLDDQQTLGPSLGPGQLQEQLTATKAQVEGLVSNLQSLLIAMGYQPPSVGDPLDSASYGSTDFERKVRGYIVCREYRDWMDRTERDFTLLSYYFPA